MKLIQDVMLPANSGKAFVLKKGEHIRIIVDGSGGDFVAFNLHNLRERFNQARTKANQGKIFLSTGDRLISKLNNTMLTIVEDTYDTGHHDLQYGMCSRQSWKILAQPGLYQRYQNLKELPDHGCYENLSQALEPWNIAPEDIPSPFNICQNMVIDSQTGKMEFGPDEARPKAGTYVELCAEMDCLVAMSACPAGGRGKAVRVQVYGEEKAT